MINSAREETLRSSLQHSLPQKKYTQPRLSTLCGAVLLTFAAPAGAVDVIFSSGFYVPGTTAPEPIVAGTVLQINGGGNKFFNAVSMTNQSGTVNWNADTLFLQNGATLNNQFLWDAKSDNALANNGGPLSSFNNSGTFRKSAGAGSTSIGSIAFTSSGIIDAQSGTIVFGGGNATFNAGSQFTGAGATVVSNNASFNGALTSANLTLSGGSFNGGAVQVNGSLNMTGGLLNGGWEVVAGQQMTFNGGNNKFLNNAALVNNGSLLWQTGDTLFLQNGSSLTNNALHDIQQSTTLANNGGPLSSYTNNNTLHVAAGKSVNVGSIAFTNNGGTLTADGTLAFGGGNVTFNNGTIFNGGGAIVISNNANFNGAFSSNNLALTGGTFSGGAAALTGTVDFSGGLLTGGWQVGAGQVWNGKTGNNKFLNSATFLNQGTVLWQSANSLFLQNGSTLDNQGLFDMQAGMALVNNGGPLSSFINSGTLHVAAAQSGSVGSIAFINNGGTIASDGTLTFGGGNATFNSGTQFSGGGVNIVSNNASFIDDFSSQNLQLTGGTYTGGNGTAGSKVVMNGTVLLNSGLLTGHWKLAGGQTFRVQSGNNKFLNNAQFTNNGNLLWQTANTLFMQNGSTLDNNGLFDMQTGAAIVNNGGPLSTFNNNGSLVVQAGQNGTIGSIAFNNNGGATIQVGNGGTLNFSGGNVNFNANSQMTGAGLVKVTNNAAFNGSFSASNLSLQGGTFNGSAAVLHGNAEWSGGLLQGGWTVAGGATFNGAAGNNKFINGGSLTNQGTLNWTTSNTLFLQNAAFLNNQGTLDLQTDAAMVFNGGPVGAFVNSGTIVKSGGVGTSTIGNNLGFDNLGVMDVQTGTIRLPDNFINHGTLMGSGAYTTNLLTNAGHVAPGESPGLLTINGNYAQTAGGFFDVDLATLGATDLLKINGTASLNGALELNCYTACHFLVGDEIVILDSTGNLTGSFLPTLTMHGFQSGAFDVVYDTSGDRVLLRVTQNVTAAIPEPLSYAMLLGGLAWLGTLARRRREGGR